MKKRILIGLAVTMLVLLMDWLLRPRSFANVSQTPGTVRIELVENNLQHYPHTIWNLETDDPAYLQLTGILEQYSYHASLRTIKGDSYMQGNDARYWLFLDFYSVQGEYTHGITMGGTGEVMIDGRIWNVSYFSNRKQLEMMDAIRNLLVEITPDE